MTDAAPLTGVRVLDLSVMISGPLAGMILADQGADVTKVESPGLGDLMRLLGSSKGGVTGIYLNNNRGKRSLVLDLAGGWLRLGKCRQRRGIPRSLRSARTSRDGHGPALRAAGVIR